MSAMDESRQPRVPLSVELLPQLGRWLVGESPRWDSDRQRLSWVDIEAGLVLAAAWSAGGFGPAEPILSLAAPVGFAVPAAGGGFVTGEAASIVQRDPDGVARRTWRVARAGERINDGAVDPGGRLVVGTLATSATAGRRNLIRLENDGTLTVLDDDLSLANGIAWSPDGATVYWADSLDGVVWAADYADAPLRRRRHATVEGGLADGLATDQEGGLWCAVWGAGEIRRLDAASARPDVLGVGIPSVTALAFAGPTCDQLIVTSSALTTEEHAEHPRRGMLVSVGVAVPGVPTPAWSMPGPMAV